MGIRDHKAKRQGQTLDQLEGIASGPPTAGDTSMVIRCLGLRKIPINEFTVEDLRLMIGQREGLMFLVPLALQHLANDPLVGGDFFEGDLLCAVLRAGREFWQRHPTLRAEVEQIVAKLPEVPKLVAQALTEFQ